MKWSVLHTQILYVNIQKRKKEKRANKHEIKLMFNMLQPFPHEISFFSSALSKCFKAATTECNKITQHPASLLHEKRRSGAETGGGGGGFVLVAPLGLTQGVL